MIRQGDLYRIDLGEPSGSRPGHRHPHVVDQNDLFNTSAINTTVVCALTSNPALAHAPGNVRLRKAEGGLPKGSVVNISHVVAVDKSYRVEKIGALSVRRVREIVDAVRLAIEPPAGRTPG